MHARAEAPPVNLALPRIQKGALWRLTSCERDGGKSQLVGEGAEGPCAVESPESALRRDSEVCALRSLPGPHAFPGSLKAGRRYLCPLGCSNKVGMRASGLGPAVNCSGASERGWGR